MFKIILLAILLSPQLSAQVSKSSIPNLEWWLKIMRYEKKISGYESEVDSKSYFMAKDGKYNPISEWQKNLSLLQQEARITDDHFACRFPGRYLYFKRSLKTIPSVDLTKCGKFNKFKEKIDLANVSLVFSSYYISKPASAFGHTLFKLQSKSGEKLNNPLLDYGVDFSASVTTSNPIMYGVLGMFGGFQARYNLMPFFLKLREYNDYESRDLWEFKIELSEIDKQFFVAHLWDMDKAQFDYYYFTENCSYHIYRFLDAVKVDWKLLDKISTLLTPHDTLTPFFEDSKKISQIKLRPSLFTKLVGAYEALDSNQKIQLYEAFEQRNLSNLNKINKEKRAAWLDALLLLVDYRYPSQILLSEGKDSNNIKDFRFRILSKRSQFDQIPNRSSEQVIQNHKTPHKSRRLQISYTTGEEKHPSRIGFNFRIGLHNLLDPTPWFNPYSTLEMGVIDAEYKLQEKQFRLNELTAAHVIAIQPFTPAFRGISWNFKLGARRNTFSQKQTLGPRLDVGVGYGHPFKSWAWASFLQTRQAYHPSETDRGYNLEVGPRLILKKHNLKWTALLDAQLLRSFSHKDRDDIAKVDLHLVYNFNANLNISIFGKYLDKQKYAGSAINFYFQ